MSKVSGKKGKNRAMTKYLAGVWQGSHIERLRIFTLNVWFGWIFIKKSRNEYCFECALFYIFDNQCGYRTGHDSLTYLVIFKNDLPDAISFRPGNCTEDRPIYTCFHSKSERFDKIKMAAELENDIQSIVTWGKKYLVNVNTSKTMLIYFNHLRELFSPFLSMANSNNQASLFVTFSSDMLCNDYTDSLP